MVSLILYQIFKEQTKTILSNIFQKIKVEGIILFSSFYEAIIIPETTIKDITRKENCRPMSLLNKNSNENIGKLNLLR